MLDDGDLRDLKQRAAEGIVASLALQAGTMVLRVGSTLVLARLLSPQDFGLVGMATAVVGIMALFKEAGLSSATIQRASVTLDDLSTLFWINLGLGTLLGLLSAAAAPAIAAFYGEPRLTAVTLAMATTFVFSGVAAQHRALLQRSLRVRALATIDLLSLAGSVAAALGMAALGLRYWALVANATLPIAGSAAGVWLVGRWIPGRPRRSDGTRRMIAYGGTITVGGVFTYLAYNLDKVLIGRFWGAEALGIYGRAYQILSLPNESLQSAVNTVAFPALSRLQNDPPRFRRYFLGIYGLFLAVALPVTVVSAVYAEDVVRVLLGPKWGTVAGVFRLLSPTILALALMNPFGWLLFARGEVRRGLGVAALIMIGAATGYVIGLGGGPAGVATGFSAAMTLLVVPVIAWAKRGSPIGGRDTARAILRPLASTLAGAVVAIALRPWTGAIETTFVRLAVSAGIVFSVHLGVLLFGFGERDTYAGLLPYVGLRPPTWLTANGVRRLVRRLAGEGSLARALRAIEQIGRHAAMAGAGRADYRRWTSPHGLQEWWDERTRIIAALVPSGTRVLEFGAGRRRLEAYLPSGCRYTPSDLVDRGGGTIVCDLNRRPLPALERGRFDVAVFGGVLEYLSDVGAIAGWIQSLGIETCIASYDEVPTRIGVRARVRERLRRWSFGYMCHLTEDDLVGVFARAGMRCVERRRWSSQRIYRFERQA